MTASPSKPLCGKQSGLGGVIVSIRQEKAYVEFFPVEEGKGMLNQIFTCFVEESSTYEYCDAVTFVYVERLPAPFTHVYVEKFPVKNLPSLR